MNNNGLSELITSKRTKKILTGKLSAIEGIIDEETRTLKDYGVVFYGGLKVIISADDMNLFSLHEETVEDENKESTRSLKFDPRRSVLRGLVGSEIDFIVKSIDQEKGIATASRKEAMELRKALEYSKHKQGDRVLARILGVGRSHAVAEIYGQYTTIPIKEIAWGRIYDIRDYVSVGDKKEVIITEISEDKIEVSMRLAQKEPYQDLILDKGYYKRYGEYEGTIRAIKDYGIFVELAPGITVLCNYPNWLGFTPELGKKVSVQIKRFKNEKRYIDGQILRDL